MSPTANRDVTPSERAFDRKPNLSHLRVIGCKALVRDPNKKDLNKLAERTDHGIYIGYNSLSNRIFKIYNTDKQRMVRSGTVIWVKDLTIKRPLNDTELPSVCKRQCTDPVGASDVPVIHKVPTVHVPVISP